MYGLVVSIAALAAFPFIFPEEFLYWSRNIRNRIKDDLRKRMSDEEWQEYEHEFSDL